MLRFERYSATRMKVFRGETSIGSIYLVPNGGFLASDCGLCITAAELRQIADKLDELNQKRQEGI